MHNAQPNPTRTVQQALAWGPVQQSRLSPADTMFTNTGRRLYVIGDVDGDFRPRTNPYDLHALGGPHPNDPLANALQGVWAQPVKGVTAYTYTVTIDGQPWRLCNAERFTQTFAAVQFEYQRGGLRAMRQDFAAQELPLLVTSLTLHNTGPEPAAVQLAFTVTFDLRDAWFTTVQQQRNHGEQVSVEAGRLVARANLAPEQWAVAVGSLPAADAQDLGVSSTGSLHFSARLAPGQQQTWHFGMVIELEGGAPAALLNLAAWLPQQETLLAEKQALYAGLLANGPRFHCQDARFEAAFDLARANFQLLEAESPALGRYYYAGLENFPFWFGIDSAYSLPGLMAGGDAAAAANAVLIGARAQTIGRVPHQISPSGKIAFPGHASVTPLWVLGLAAAYRWTGDQDLLAAAYPTALEGLFDYTLGIIDPDGDGYPSGPGIVERDDMGAEKLDCVSYLWAALHALRELALDQQDLASAERAHQAAGRIAARFQQDWWDEAGGTYAMSIDETSHELRPMPHWAVVVPLEVGLATPEHALTTLATLRGSFLNDWGLKHTSGSDDQVWTLPTAVLSHAAYRYGDDPLGFQMLAHLVDTLDHGSIGMFHELIPEGMCFVQLWSSAMFVRGLIEDVLGVEVDAARHTVRIAPHLPPAWQFAGLDELSFGAHRITVRIEPGGLRVTHLRGPAPLVVTLGGPGQPVTAALEPGQTYTHVSLP